MKSNNSYQITIPSFVKNKQSGKKQGMLSVAEHKKPIPFKTKRVYWITDLSSDNIRGSHAHHKTEQLIFCLHGSCKISKDDGKNEVEEYTLDSPDKGFFAGTYVWHTLYDFKDDPVILVIASGEYDEADYIRDYEEFKSCVNEQTSNRRRSWSSPRY